MEVIKDDYIRKIEAVKILQKAYTEGRIKAKDGCISVLDDINALPKADVQPVNQWISVKDRLPEENILVLCYARSTTGEGNSYFLGALAHGEFWFLKVNDIEHVSYPVLHWEVTHWQPLPESPKEE